MPTDRAAMPGGEASDQAPIHVLASLCRGDWVAIGLNVGAIVMTVAFTITLHLFEKHNRDVEEAAQIKNPYDGFMSATFWASIAFTVVLAGAVAYQVALQLRAAKALRRIER